MTRDRKIYLRLIKELEAAHKALDKVDARVHQLLDEYDKEWARKRIEQLTKEGKLP